MVDLIRTADDCLEEMLDELCEALERNEVFSWDLETTGFNPFTRKVTGMSFAVPDRMVPAQCVFGCCPGKMFPKAWYLPFVPERATHMTNEEARQKFPGRFFSFRRTIDRVKPHLENPNKRKIGQNSKFDLKFTGQSGVRLRGQIIDTCIASSMCDENRSKHDLKTLAFDHLGHQMVKFEELGGIFSPSIELYGADDAAQCLRLWQDRFEPQLKKEGLLKVFLELECRVVPVLTYMEMHGVRIDVDYLDELDKYLRTEQQKAEDDAFQMAGQRFQISAPEAVGRLLFEKLKWRKKGIVKTATGKYSTSEEVLERYMGDKRYGPLAKAILVHRKLGKLKSTYVDTLREDARAMDGRVRSLFNQVHKPWEDKGGAVTGRFSSSRDEELGGLNFQNIPTRKNDYLGDTGKRIRHSFVSEPDKDLIVLDFSQIELRFMAHFSQDPTLLMAYRDWVCAECGAKGSLDIAAHACPQCKAPEGHRDRNKKCKICATIDKPPGQPMHGFCLGLDLHQITADICKVDRDMGKTVNFALLYGMIAKTLAERIECSISLAEQIVHNYFKGYPGIRGYHEEQIRQVMRTGFVQTICKRRRRFPHKRGRSVNPWEREWRQAVNHPIQGSAADLMKIAMRNIHERLDREDRLQHTGILLQVHDELVAEGPESESKYTYSLMKHEMEFAIKLRVPVVAEGGIGKNWASCK